MAAAERMTASPEMCPAAAMTCCAAGPKAATHSMYSGMANTCTMRFGTSHILACVQASLHVRIL